VLIKLADQVQLLRDSRQLATRSWRERRRRTMDLFAPLAIGLACGRSSGSWKIWRPLPRSHTYKNSRVSWTRNA